MKSQNGASCHHIPSPPRPSPDRAAVERAARLFRALGDGPRLSLLLSLSQGECCVSELVTASGEKFSTVSQRLRLLRTEGLVLHRRVASHVYYKLADQHVERLLANALDHACELNQDHPTEEDVE